MAVQTRKVRSLSPPPSSSASSYPSTPPYPDTTPVCFCCKTFGRCISSRVNSLFRRLFRFVLIFFFLGGGGGGINNICTNKNENNLFKEGGTFKEKYLAFSSDDPCGASLDHMEGRLTSKQKFPCRGVR